MSESDIESVPSRCKTLHTEEHLQEQLMSQITATRKGNIVTVRNKYWEVEHDARAGGCWTSVKFLNGTGKNLLAAPISSRVRNLDPHPASDASSPFFYEAKFDRDAKITIENLPIGAVVLVEGTYRL